jgi:hypothetical protein
MAELAEPIYYRNAQWAVTGYGIECLEDVYYISRDRLDGTFTDSGLPEWPMHLAEKNWVNDQLFLEAFAIALCVHDSKPEFRNGWFAEVQRITTKTRSEEKRFKEARPNPPDGLFDVLSISDLLKP